MALRVLAPGSKGADVAALQRLIAYYDPGPNTKPFVDGDFGSRTRVALEEFKRANLERVDSIATPEWQTKYTNQKIGFPAQPGPWPPKASASAPSSSSSPASPLQLPRVSLPLVIGGAAAVGALGLFAAALARRGRRKVGSRA